MCRILTTLALILSYVGAINWGLISVFNLNLVEFLFGSYPYLVKILYLAVGASGVVGIWNLLMPLEKKKVL